MQLPTFFIEYLINGSCALVWISWLLIVFGAIDRVPDMGAGKLALLVPALYVLGMTIDWIARWVVKKLLKENLLEPLLKKIGILKIESLERDRPGGQVEKRAATLALRSKEATREYSMRSSRDRVARGALINLILATIVLTTWYDNLKPPSLKLSVHLIWVIGIILVILFFVVWYHFEERTSAYLDAAYDIISTPNNPDTPSQELNNSDTD
jgi:hypothetical protein